MPKKSNQSRESRPYFRIQRALQITDSHCGPAVIQMLLSNLGISVSQEDIALAGQAADLIDLHGMRVDQMGQAVKVLAPNAQFWYKEQSTLDDLTLLIRAYRYPVGVEWQGYFDDEGGEIPDPEPDYGHYSLVTHVDEDRDELVVVDPNKYFVDRDRIFGLEEFDERWWDRNEVIDTQTGRPGHVKEDHMMFIVTPPEATFPDRLAMIKG